jgi:hypothetical protein
VLSAGVQEMGQQEEKESKGLARMLQTSDILTRGLGGNAGPKKDQLGPAWIDLGQLGRVFRPIAGEDLLGKAGAVGTKRRRGRGQ